jgi:hypothetical protein
MRVTRSFAVGFTVTLFALGSFGQSPRSPRSDVAPVETNEVQDLLAGRVRSDACSFASSASCSATRTGNAGSCNDGEYWLDFHTFSATAGQTLTVAATTALSSPAIVVTIQDGSTGAIRAVNYGARSATVSYTFPTSGSYAVGVGFLSKFFTGSYTATFTCASASTTCRVSAKLPRGVAVSSTLGAADASCSSSGDAYYKLFEFEGVADTPVRITVSGSTFPAYVEVESEDDNAGVYRNSDAADPFTIFYPTRSGRQFVWVGNDDNATSGGSFTIRVDDEPLEACRRRATRH